MEIFCLSFQLQPSCSNVLTTNNLFKRDGFFQDFLFAVGGVGKEFSSISLSSLEGKKLDRYIAILILFPCLAHMLSEGNFSSGNMLKVKGG